MDEEIEIVVEDEEIDITSSMSPDFLKGDKGDKRR